jgi:osmoprotectant transport system substrate-binding protein
VNLRLSHRIRARRVTAGLLTLVVLLLSACSSSTTRSAGGQPHSSTASSPSSTGTTSGTPTAASLPGTGKPTVTIGDKNYTEQFLLGDLYREALQAQGFTVDLNQNIGPTSVTLQALASGSLDMYPEYLNVFDSSIARYRRDFASQAGAYTAAQRYASDHSLQLLAPTPFSDTEAIGVTVGYAVANHLRSLRDLVKVAPTLNVGGPPQFQQTDPGLTQLEHTYGFTPASFKALAVGDQYTALNGGTIQAADVNTTDGQLATGDYRILSDPENVLGWGNAVPVVASRAVLSEGPAFVATVNRISALLTTPVMRQLNLAVDLAGQDPAAVAKEFLETHGMIPPSPS